MGGVRPTAVFSLANHQRANWRAVHTLLMERYPPL